MEALNGFSHVHHPMMSASYSLKAAPLKQLWLWEQWAEHTFQVVGEEWGSSSCLGPVSGSTGGHLLQQGDSPEDTRT